jgi:hypothetical protein
MMPARKTPRGAALVAAVILLGITGMAVGAAVIAAGDDARTTTLRADSLRAFYAAESGVQLGLHALNESPADPFTGPLSLPGGATIEAVAPFSPTEPTEATFAGRAGQAERHVRIRVR